MGIDVLTLSKSKAYTNQVALGLSNVTVNNKDGVVTFVLNDGSSASYTFPKPENGISVTAVNDKGNGKFTLSFSNGTESEIIQTVKGAKGDKGNPGEKGNPGYTPVKGTDYWTSEDISEIQSYIDTQIGGALNGSY